MPLRVRLTLWYGTALALVLMHLLRGPVCHDSEKSPRHSR